MRSLRPAAAALMAAALVVSLHAPAQSRIVARPSGGGAGGYGQGHDAGFFLRLSAGFGGARTESDLTAPGQDGTLELSGSTGDVNLAIGGIVAPNLALHGTLLGWTISGPNVEAPDVEVHIPGDLSLAGLGAGITYFFMPTNLYLSSSLGFGTLDYEGIETDAGFLLDLTLGKEWWVGERWGLGLAGAFGYHNVPEHNLDTSWTGTSVGLRFSATLN